MLIKLNKLIELKRIKAKGWEAGKLGSWEA
jgi:hypothetical protein